MKRTLKRSRLITTIIAAALALSAGSALAATVTSRIRTAQYDGYAVWPPAPWEWEEDNTDGEQDFTMESPDIVESGDQYSEEEWENEEEPEEYDSEDDETVEENGSDPRTVGEVIDDTLSGGGCSAGVELWTLLPLGLMAFRKPHTR